MEHILIYAIELTIDYRDGCDSELWERGTLQKKNSPSEKKKSLD